MEKKKNSSKLRQPVEAVTWKKKVKINVEKEFSEGIKCFRAVVEYGLRQESGLYVPSRSMALRHAFDHCNGFNYRVMSVDGVREEKFALW